MPSQRIRNTIRQNLIALDHQLRQEIEDALNQTAQDLQAEYRKITAQWQHKPTFRVATALGRNAIVVTITPRQSKGGMIWIWVDKGTGQYGQRKAAYPIRPKRSNRKGLLYFRTQYSARTAPVAKYNVGAGSASGPLIAKRGVTHPGIRPREFTQETEKKLRPPLAARIENAMRRAVRRAAR